MPVSERRRSSDDRPESRRPLESVAQNGTYDANEIAALLQCSTRHIWRLRDSGAMPKPIRVGRLIRWPIGSIQSWIADGCPASRKAVRS